MIPHQYAFKHDINKANKIANENNKQRGVSQKWKSISYYTADMNLNFWFVRRKLVSTAQSYPKNEIYISSASVPILPQVVELNLRSTVQGEVNPTGGGSNR